MSESLIDRARGGDEDAFRALTEPHRRELHLHCYRILGSAQDAEDAVQETLLAAWRGLATFRQRASVRTWLYRIATNVSLNAVRAQRRRPAKAWDIPGIDPPHPTRDGHVLWLGPYPDPVDWPTDLPVGPEARYEQTESISLAFVTALQVLPPRQLAVLVLRDVVGFPAAEVAEMLDTTVTAVNSALARARTALELVRGERPVPAPAAGSAQERAVVTRFVRAYESHDLPGLVSLFTDDVFMSMPPMTLEYVGAKAATDFMALLMAPGRSYRLLPTRANYQPAFGAYVQRPDGRWHASGLFVLTLAAERISATVRFEPDVFGGFGLPAVLGSATSRSM